MVSETDSLGLLSNQPKNAKSAIIQKLSKQWPLTAKQLTHSVQREYGMSITYQAVHKALGELEKENVIQKFDSKYQLNEEWINQLKQISNDISKSYSRNEPLQFDKEIIQMHFTKWVDVGRFVAFDFKEQAPNPQKKPVISCWIHVWPVLTVSIEETQRLAKIAAIEGHYCISPSSTNIDQNFSSFLEKMNKRSLTGAKIKLDHDYAIKGDYIANVYYDNSFSKKIDDFYSQTKDANHMDYEKLQKLATEKTDIHLIIVKNALLAEKLRNEALSFFKSKK